MVDTGDLKSLARKGVRVQVPPRAPQLFQAELDPACGCSGLRYTRSGHVVARLLGTSPAFHIFCAFLRVGLMKAFEDALVFLPRL